MVVIRKNIKRNKGEQALFDKIRYFFYITNEREWSQDAIVFSANDRCNQENLVAQLKGGVPALQMPVDNLESNWAYMVMTALAWNLKSRWARTLPESPGRWREQHCQQKEWVLRLEFRSFINAFVLLPCQIVKTGRKLVYRLLNCIRLVSCALTCRGRLEDFPLETSTCVDAYATQSSGISGDSILNFSLPAACRSGVIAASVLFRKLLSTPGDGLSPSEIAMLLPPRPQRPRSCPSLLLRPPPASLLQRLLPASRVHEFRNWLDIQVIAVLPKIPLAQAVSFSRNHREALLRFTQRGFLNIDNNASERAMRPAALGRKNCLFAGSNEGGRTAAERYTMTQTCRRHGIDPFVYLRDVLTRLPQSDFHDLADLFAQQWAKSQIAQIAVPT